MRRSASLLVLVCGCFLFAPTGSPEASSPRSNPAVLAAQFADTSQPYGKLVLVGTNYSTFEGAQQGLYVVNVDGRGLRQITVGRDEEPHWSRDGGWIAYVHAVGLSEQVMIVRGDGSGRPRMLGGGERGSLSAPSPWSPDGSLLAWGGCRGLCVFDLASSRHRSIALGGGDSDGFAWSPDGRKLVAVDGSGRLVVVDTLGETKAILATKGAYPAWSPDGRQIAFRDAKFNLKLVPAGGGRARVVARDATAGPTWSPDGRRLLYSEYTRSTGERVRRLNVGSGRNKVLANTAGITHWGPNGASIAYTRSRSPYDPERDVWTMAATGADLRQVTHAFPTGVSFNDFDWIPGTVPVHTASPPNLLSLPTSSELSLDWVDGLAQAGAPDSVVYRDGAICDPDAENESAMFEAWTPPATSVVTTTTPCLDMALRSFAVGASLVAWASDYDLAGHTTIAVARPGTSDAQIASWNAAEEAPDIGWRSEIGDLVSDGSTIFFESWDANSHPMLWRIADSVIPHAISVPLPSDAGYLIDADGGRVVLSGSSGDLVVLAPDGTVTSRLPLHSLIPNPSIGISQGRVRIGGGLVGTISGDTLRVYDEDGGTLRHAIALSHASGHPRLLAIGPGRAVYESGIEVHLLRLQDGLDQTLSLPGQAGPIGAVLTTTGLFVSYNRSYESKQGHILFTPTAGLP